MGAVYKITNIINSKSYIGKTSRSVEERWSEHKRSALNKNVHNRPLYKAINKYGIDSFNIEILYESNDNSALLTKEQELIKKYDTYKNGYNATLGGEGTLKEISEKDVELIIFLYESGESILNIASSINLDERTVRRLLNENDIKTRTTYEHSKKKVYSRELNMEFNSIADAARYLFNTGKAKSIRGASTGISRVARGERPHYLKTTWTFI